MPPDSLLGGAAAARVPRAARNRAARLVAAGELVRVLPGTVVRAGTETRRDVLAAAIAAYDPTAVLTGAAAAALHLRPDSWPAVLTFVSVRRWRLAAPWFVAARGAVPPEHLRLLPVRHVDPAMAALQVADREGPGPVHAALRRRLCTPAELASAAVALSGQPGNAARRRLAASCRAMPWSEPEAACHALLRRAGITGWRGNVRVRVRDAWFVLDVGFGAERVALEVDSWAYHGSRAAFEADRLRHNALEAAGWLVLHVTPDMLEDRPREVVGWVRRVLAERRA